MAETDTFWDFWDDEEPLFRVMRTVAACTSGYRPEPPFGDCDTCPCKRACHAITTGLIAAAKHKMAIRKEKAQGPKTNGSTL